MYFRWDNPGVKLSDRMSYITSSLFIDNCYVGYD